MRLPTLRPGFPEASDQGLCSGSTFAGARRCPATPYPGLFSWDAFYETLYPYASSETLFQERLSMKVCVVGAGGVGGLLAAVLRRAGVDVSLLVTERHLKAIRSNGLALIAPEGRFSVEIR